MNRIKKSLPAIALVAVLLITVIGGTFAYFSQTDTADNYLSVKDYNSTLEENFIPPVDGFTPGVEVTKEVGVRNTGDIPMIVRMSYTEFWEGIGNGTLTFADADPDGLYNGDLDPTSLVSKTAGTGWTYGDDGYFYYMTVLDPTQATTPFITGITLKDVAVTTTTTYIVKYWDDTAGVFVDSAALNEADKDLLIAGLVAPDYLASVITNEASSLDGGNDYRLQLTTETLQAVNEAAATWTPTNTAVVAFLGAITP